MGGTALFSLPGQRDFRRDTFGRVRVAVVGASSGLGRCIATSLGQAGDSVALLARRRERLVDAAEEAGPGSLAVACDVTDEASVSQAVAAAVDGLGGLDGLVYTAGMAPLARLVDLRADQWRQAFDTNVVGAALVTAAALPHLIESGGVATYLSSIAASMTPPWPGLGAYAASKAALDTMVEAWRSEHPTVGFTRVVVGDCAGGDGPSMTEFPMSWDLELLGELHPEWTARQYLSGSLLEVADLVRVVDTVLRLGRSACVPSVAVIPRPDRGSSRPRLDEALRSAEPRRPGGTTA